MGADTFTEHAMGDDPQVAFRDAVRDAQYDYGHAGYTGTIAEKDGFVIIDRTPRTIDGATSEARRLIEDEDERINNKWRPAGALRTERGWLFFGWASA